LFSLLFFHSGFHHSFFLPGNNSLQLLGLSPLLFSLTTCLKLTMVSSLWQQGPLGQALPPKMSRKRPSSSASSRRSSPWRASDRKNSGTPMLWLACPSKSFGTFWRQWMSAMNQISLLTFERSFAWAVWKKQVAILF
jgi:hypothetical protein